MTLSNPFPNAPAREWAQSPMLKRRLDPKADYKKKAWDGERSHGFASWQPVVLSQEEIAQLKQQPKREPKENPISETPEAFQKANKPTDSGADTSAQVVDAGDQVSEPAQMAQPDQAQSSAESADAPAAPPAQAEAQAQVNVPAPDEAEQLASPGQSDTAGQGEAPSLDSEAGLETSTAQQTAAGHEDGLTDDRVSQLEQGRAQGHAAGYEQGLVDGKAQGHAAGLAEGIEQGLAQAAQQQEAALDTAIAALTQAAADVTTLNDNPAQHFEPLKRLALHLAEELVRGELMLDSAAIERLIQAALEQLDNPSKRVRVALHPDDIAALTAQGKQLGAGVVMVADKAMLRGGARVTSNDAVVQDLIDNRLGHLADELLIDKGQWLNDSQALQQGVAWATKASVLERMSATEDAAEVVAPAGDDHPVMPVASSSPGEPDDLGEPDDSGMNGIDRMSEADALDDDPSDYSLHASDVIATSDDVTDEPVQAEPLDDSSAEDAPADVTPSDTASDDDQA